MSGNTYVALYRKSINSEVMKNANLWMFWCYCLMKATQKPYNALVGHIVVPLEPGQFVFGRRAASQELPLSEREVRTCLTTLIELGNVTQKATNRYSVVTITKFSDYQVTYTESGQKIVPAATQGRPKGDHVQEDNKNNNSNEKRAQQQFGLMSKDDQINMDRYIRMTRFPERKEEALDAIDRLNARYM